MDEQVEPAAELLTDRGEDTVDVLVRADVAFEHERARDALGEVAHVLLDPFALVCEREPRSLVREALRDRPRDRPAVGHAHHERGLSVEPSGGRHGGGL